MNEKPKLTTLDVIKYVGGFAAKHAVSSVVTTFTRSYLPMPTSKIQRIGFTLGTVTLGSMVGRAAENHVYDEIDDLFNFVKKVETGFAELQTQKSE